MLLAICDEKNYTIVDVGQCGSKTDSGVVINSEMGKKFEQRSFDLHEVESLERCLVG